MTTVSEVVLMSIARAGDAANRKTNAKKNAMRV